jgi:hypothetical protein
MRNLQPLKPTVGYELVIYQSLARGLKEFRRSKNIPGIIRFATNTSDTVHWSVVHKAQVSGTWVGFC